MFIEAQNAYHQAGKQEEALKGVNLKNLDFITKRQRKDHNNVKSGFYNIIM